MFWSLEKSLISYDPSLGFTVIWFEQLKQLKQLKRMGWAFDTSGIKAQYERPQALQPRHARIAGTGMTTAASRWRSKSKVLGKHREKLGEKRFFYKVAYPPFLGHQFFGQWKHLARIQKQNSSSKTQERHIAGWVCKPLSCWAMESRTSKCQDFEQKTMNYMEVSVSSWGYPQLSSIDFPWGFSMK